MHGPATSRRRFVAAAACASIGLRSALAAEPRGSQQAAQSANVKLPGFVDLQVNGFGGVDFGDASTTAEGVHRAAEAVYRTGVTQFLPTLITSPFDTFARCSRTLLAARHPAIAGLHMEGPYISALDGARGAHPKQHVRAAELHDFKRRQDAAEGRIRLVTLAPEAPGALRLIEHLVASGVRVAIGHTAGTRDEIHAAVKAGATLSTHLGNGCAGTLPRHPNLLWEQLADDRLLASFIVDGHHLPEATVRAMVRAKTQARSILVTDAIAAAGMPPGLYTLGGQQVELDASGRVAAPGAPNLAGSALTMPAAISNTARFTGLALDEVVEMASVRPARYLGLEPLGTVEAEWSPQGSGLRVLRVSA